MKTHQPPGQEQCPVQTVAGPTPAGPGNAALCDELADFQAGAEEARGHGALALDLHAALADPQSPPDPADLRILVMCRPLSARAGLFHDQGFWAASFWQQAPLGPGEVRALVDPLHRWDEVVLPADGRARAELIRAWAMEVPGQVPRLLLDPQRRAALLEGLAGLDRLLVLHALARPAEAVDDPYLLLQEAILLERLAIVKGGPGAWGPGARAGILREAARLHQAAGAARRGPGGLGANGNTSLDNGARASAPPSMSALPCRSGADEVRAAPVDPRWRPVRLWSTTRLLDRSGPTQSPRARGRAYGGGGRCEAGLRHRGEAVGPHAVRPIGRSFA